MSADERQGPGGHDAIAVVDFGGQYAHLIATKVRRQRVLAEVRQPEESIEAFRGYRGVIISGSPSLSSHGQDSAYNKAIFDLPVPILGFCFGHQEIAKHYGGRVIHGGREWGPVDFRRSRPHPLFAGLAEIERVWMSHFDSVVEVGPGFEELGTSRLGDGEEHRFAALGSDALGRYGLQFHPEVDDTAHGDRMIANFVLDICGCRPSWTMERYLEEQLEAIRARAADQRVFLLVSGGVDSTVAALLLGRALGPERLQLLHVDNGLMRQGESREVLALLRGLGLGRQLHFVDAGDEFLAALEGLTEPERKRRAIGDTFVRVFEREAGRLGLGDHLLGQGTIYPDTIETGGTRRADTIKTHHNRVPIVEELIARGRVIEPLKELYKVEVRELGASLGIPREVLGRHPFPGPGLGVRALCADGADPEPGELERISAEAGALARPHGLAALGLPVRSVGVKADLRSYERPVLLAGAAPFERLLGVAGEIYQRVAGVNRCALWLGGELPRAARPLGATLTRQRLALLREADARVMAGLRRHGAYDTVWQCPTVLVPLELDGRGRELVVVRPVLSERAMTARPAELPAALCAELAAELLPLEGVSGLALDLTTKPPGTIEWE